MMAHEIKQSVLVLLLAAIVGGLAGQFWPCIAIAAVVLLALHLNRLRQMARFARRESAAPAISRASMWRDVMAMVERLQRQSRKRKKRMHKVVERYQQAVDANPDGAIIIDGTRRIEWINRAAARMLGLQRQRDIGQPITNLLRDPSFAEFLNLPMSEDGFECSSPVLDEQQLVIRVVPHGTAKRMLIVRDVTRIHALEQIRQDFVANVSHELRSPLTVIVGYLEGLREDSALPQRIGRPLEQMWQQACRMCDIVEDLLRLSRLESEPDAALLQRIDVNQMVTQILDGAARLSEFDHDVNLEVDVSLTVLGDSNELHSAFSNLIINAVQYSPGGGRIDVRWYVDEQGCGIFEVCDTGVGIEAQHLSRLTERFYRVDKARSRELGGTGLGLAIVKHVLIRHGARLEIQSEPGEGSCFQCIFPTSRVQQVSPPQAVAEG